LVSGWYQQPPHDEGDRAVVRLGEPIRSAYVLIERDRLANVTSLAHERWKRRTPSSAGGWGSARHPRTVAGTATLGGSRRDAPSGFSAGFRRVVALGRLLDLGRLAWRRSVARSRV